MISARKSVIRGGFIGLGVGAFYMSWGPLELYFTKVILLCMHGFIFAKCGDLNEAEIITLLVVYTLLTITFAAAVSAVTFLLIDRALDRAQKAGAQLL